jgi:hypothetical protein
MRTKYFSVLLLTALVGLSACGGDDGDDTPDASDNGGADAMTSTPDAMTQSSNAIGDMCTPDAELGQGDCPAEHRCLGLQGGSRPWCSKECMSDAACMADYTGPGMPACIFQISITDENNNPIDQFVACGIVCEDLSGGNICPTCDGTCPTGMTCTAALQNQQMEHVANACQ